jgi:L-aspartate semialdehyde sulfurtransferase ferredoxin
VISRKIVLKFPRRLVDRPIISALIKRYNLDFNILKAQVTPREEGLMVIELLSEGAPALEEGIKYLTETGVGVQPLSQDIIRNEDRCTHCGACTSVCPTGALSLDRLSMRVIYDNAKCIACELCIRACPPRAMEAHF